MPIYAPRQTRVPNSPPRFYAAPPAQEDMVARLRARVGGLVATEADWEAMRVQSECRQRALDAYNKGLRRRDRRALRPPPAWSRQYTPAMPTTPTRDQRLCPGAVRTLLLIRAAIGRDSGRIIKRRYLAQTLGYSERTAQRHISALRRFGYITTEPVFTPDGRQHGQRFRVTDAARPFWTAREPRMSPLKDFPVNGESKEGQNPAAFSKEFTCKGISATTERRPPSG